MTLRTIKTKTKRRGKNIMTNKKTLELDGTPDHCYNCGVGIERGWLCEVKVWVKTPLDGSLKFVGEPKKGEPKYVNDKICPACVLIIAGVLNKNVLAPERREKGVVVI